MRLRLNYRDWHFFITLSKSGTMKGVNSKLYNNIHFLMWDFDGKGRSEVRASLRAIQKKHRLSNIYVLSTGVEGYWHAYCFKRYSWPEALMILASTSLLDKVYFNIGVLRGYWTLRISDKKGREFSHAFTLRSPVAEDVNPQEINSFIKYQTKNI